MKVCILGLGVIGNSLVQFLSSKSIEIHLSTSRPKHLFNSPDNKVHAYQYGQISRLENKIVIDKCIITTRIDLLTEEQQSSLYDDIKSLNSIGCEFINLSSVAVYGSSLLPRKEEADLNPVNAYGEMKAKIEISLDRIIQNENLTNLRIANLFGKKGFDDLTNKALNSFRDNEKVDIPNNHNLRDFIFYNDLEIFLLDWIFNVVRSHGNLNFATGVSVSTEDWINSIGRITNISPEIGRGIAEPLQYSVIDVQKLKRVWNKPFTDTNLGLIEYITALNSKR